MSRSATTTSTSRTGPDPTTPPADAASHPLATILWGVFLDAGLAIIVYFGLRAAGVEPYWALLGGAVVAGLRLLYGLVRARRIEGFAAFMCIGFLIGTGLAFITGSDRFLLLKDSFSTAILAVVFLGSCLVGKPFIFHAAKRFSAAGSAQDEQWDRRWEELPGFRRTFRTMTIVWAAAFLLESVVRVPLIYLLPIDTAAAVSAVLMPATLIGLLIWTGRRGRRAERRLADASPVGESMR